MEERFCKLVEWMGDMIDRGECDGYDVKYFEKFKRYVLNWDVVERCIEEENEDGFSDGWDDVKFVEGV